MELGPGALMAKLYVLSAYRNIPIHPDDRHLLGMFWRDNFYVDLTLPFSLRSTPFILYSVASMIEWILRTNYHIRFLFHYLHDFLTLASANSSECATNVTIARSVFHQLGVPLHPDKCKGPSSTLVFLGIELDPVAQIARLPPQKFTQQST